MRKVRIQYIERKFNHYVSVEKVFRQIEKGLDAAAFDVSFQQLPYFNTFFGMLKNLLIFRFNKNADIYHVTGDCHYIAFVLPPRNTVLTIHDLRFLNTRTGLRRWILKKILLDWPLKKLTYITAVSAATKCEILHNSACDPNKIRIIENPLDNFFFTNKRREFDTAMPNILQIGTPPHKNIINLIKAVEGLTCHLTIVGELNSDIKTLLVEKDIRYTNKSELDSDAIKSEYQKADLVVFCSLYEGFGLPIIEAQAMQKPVVTSDISPLKEVAGEGGAVLVNPYDYKSIREGILRVINNPNIRESLRKKGLKNIERFERLNIAAMYETLYNEIMVNRSTGHEQIAKQSNILFPQPKDAGEARDMLKILSKEITPVSRCVFIKYGLELQK